MLIFFFHEWIPLIPFHRSWNFLKCHRVPQILGPGFGIWPINKVSCVLRVWYRIFLGGGSLFFLGHKSWQVWRVWFCIDFVSRYDCICKQKLSINLAVASGFPSMLLETSLGAWERVQLGCEWGKRWKVWVGHRQPHYLLLPKAPWVVNPPRVTLVYYITSVVIMYFILSPFCCKWLSQFSH